ncbi:cupin domain-containing protein [Microdochium nivale]|nr:cupin domain-containing protein [Microdochium nivale]
MALNGKLSHPKRYITTTNDEGLAVVDTSLPAEAPFYELGPGDASFAQCYVTNSFPAKLNDNADLNVYQDFLKQPPGLVVGGGTVLRYVDMQPGATSPMHKTLSLDYGIVLEGEIELVLDSGETRQMKRGDVCVQRATMHAWRNMSQTEWGRMLYILQPCEPFTVAGKEVKEDLGDMKGVAKST